MYEIRKEFQHFQSKIDQLDMLIEKDPLMKALNFIPPQDLVSSQNLIADFPQLKLFEEQGNNLTKARAYFLSLRSTISMGVSRMNLIASNDAMFKLVDTLENRSFFPKKEHGKTKFHSLTGFSV